MKKFMIPFVVSASLFTSTQLFAHSAQQAQSIGQTARRAKALVDRILSNAPAGGSFNTPRPQPGFPNPAPRPTWPGTGGGPRFPWQENDNLALPIFTQAGAELNIAANYAFEALDSYLRGQFQMGNFKFVSSCSRLSTAKSALARANFAAVQPPVGFFGVFNNEVLSMLNEIENARRTNQCL